MRHPRGQTLPLWIVAITSTFVLMFMALNYGNTIRWQVRAQNAADAAAMALTSIQTERFNMMTEMLYATNVEEFRIRRLLNAVLLTAQKSGGCVAAATCAADYTLLTAAYVRAVSRYTYDAQALNDVSANATYVNLQNDATSLLTHLQSSTVCNQQSATVTTVNPDGGDCAFQYTAVWQARTGLNPVEEDALGNCIPGLGRTCTSSGGTADSEMADYVPQSVDVVVCAKVPPLLPAFGPLQPQPYYAVGRAAATAVMVEEDWFQPGALTDNVRLSGTPFQYDEGYGTLSLSPYDWYQVKYGGNAAAAFPAYGAFQSPALSKDDLSARLGWWNAVPIRPFSPASNIVYSTYCK